MRHSTLVILVTLLLPAAAFAGPGERGAGSERGETPGERGERIDPDRRAKVMDKIDAIRIARLTGALELDAAGAEKLFPVLRPFQERRRKAFSERFDALRAIDDQLDSEKPDEKELGRQLEVLQVSNAELADIGVDEYKALKPVLDPVQLARYYRFQAEFERRIGELIRDIKGGGDGQAAGGRGKLKEKGGRDKLLPPPR